MTEKGKGGRSSGKSGVLSVDEKYSQWKSLVPILYDWLANHNLVWPSLSCRWGPLLEQATYKSRQRLCLSEQFNEEARSPVVKKFKTIIHPDEVNRIRELPQNINIVATHTDSPDVLIWDVENQPTRHAVLGAHSSHPDLILTGHQENAEFALAMCSCELMVFSGGKDKLVVLWSIQDHASTLATEPGSAKSISAGPNIKSAAKNNGTADSPSIGARGIYKGHDEPMEDVQFCLTRASGNGANLLRA